MQAVLGTAALCKTVCKLLPTALAALCSLYSTDALRVILSTHSLDAKLAKELMVLFLYLCSEAWLALKDCIQGWQCKITIA